MKSKIQNPKSKIIFFFLIFGLLLPSFGLIHSPQVSFAQGEENFVLFFTFASINGSSVWEEPLIKQPETVGEAKELAEKALEVSKKELPGMIEKIWKEEVLPIWQKMWGWFKKTFWDPYLGPFFKKEIEKRKPQIQEEFQKEKEEMKKSAKEEVPKATKSLWEKFKELIK